MRRLHVCSHDTMFLLVDWAQACEWPIHRWIRQFPLVVWLHEIARVLQTERASLIGEWSERHQKVLSLYALRACMFTSYYDVWSVGFKIVGDQYIDEPLTILFAVWLHDKSHRAANRARPIDRRSIWKKPCTSAKKHSFVIHDVYTYVHMILCFLVDWSQDCEWPINKWIRQFPGSVTKW